MITITRKRDNGEHDIKITGDDLPTVTIGSPDTFHGVEEDAEVISLESYISKAGERVAVATMTLREARRINRELCGMRDCCCGDGLAYEVNAADGTAKVYVVVDVDDILGALSRQVSHA